MKKLFIAAAIFAVLSSCNKTTNNSPITIKGSLLPLKAGNTWIYQDSIFDATGNLLDNYPDTAFVTGQTVNISGYTFYGYSDSLGYFGSSQSLLACDSNAYAILQLNNINGATPYIFFQIAPSDNYLFGTAQDNSNPSCMGTYYAYGFISTYNVNGYSCYKNIDYETDCNGNIITEDVFYVSPGTGIVRIESYFPVAGSNVPYLYFSQTLVSAKIN